MRSDFVLREARKRAVELVEWAALPFGTEEEPAPRSNQRPSMLAMGWSSPLRASWTLDEEDDEEEEVAVIQVAAKAPMWVMNDWTADDEEDELEPISATMEFWAAKAK